MRLFKTTSRRTYRAPRQRVGYSTTVKAKTRLKRWAKRRTKQLWRKAKQRVRSRWRKTRRQVRGRWQQHQRRRATYNRQIARNAQQFQQRNAKIHASVTSQSDSGTLPGQVKLPPQDGAMATCRRCSNEVQYNGRRGRWEHTGKGNAECFQRRRG